MNRKLAHWCGWIFCLSIGLALMTTSAFAQPNHYVVFDQDTMGPAGTDLNSILVLLQDPSVHLLGITVPTGDGWRDEEVAHALRMLELVGRTDVPVVPGAVFPLVRTRQWTEQWERLYGKQVYMGAWGSAFRPEAHGPYVVPPLVEGNPTTKPLNENAAEFLIRMVNKYPHQVTILAAGPLTDIALAISLNPQFAETAQQLVLMGGSLNPHTDNPEFADNPRHEFNFWFDPEATRITLRAPWAKITDITVDASIETHLTAAMLAKLGQTHTAAAQYIAKYTDRKPGDIDYMWDELAAAIWLDSSLITHERNVYMSTSLDRGSSYGDTLIWSAKNKPDISLQKVHAVTSVNAPAFEKFFMNLMSKPMPHAHDPLILQQPGTNTH